MRIAELSARARIPVGRIKFYLREGLMPRGHLEGINQASYDDQHLQRLVLLRALKDVGGLSIDQCKQVLGVIDANGGSEPEAALGRLTRRARTAPAYDPERIDQARIDCLTWLRGQGLSVDPAHPAFADLVESWLAIEDLSDAERSHHLEDHAFHLTAARLMARHELPAERPPAPSEELLETLVYEPFLLALRRLARSSRREELAARVTDLAAK